VADDEAEEHPDHEDAVDVRSHDLTSFLTHGCVEVLSQARDLGAQQLLATPQEDQNSAATSTCGVREDHVVLVHATS